VIFRNSKEFPTGKTETLGNSPEFLKGEEREVRRKCRWGFLERKWEGRTGRP
jgi:hypothetical protein